MRQEQAADAEAAEVELLREMLERTSVIEERAGGWNAAPLRHVPYACRGMRPMYTIEPWAKGVIDTCKDQGLRPGTAFATSGLARLDDSANLDTAVVLRRRRSENLAAARSTERPAWDSTPKRYCPPALDGLQPVTREPWASDLELYQARESRQIGLANANTRRAARIAWRMASPPRGGSSTWLATRAA